MTRSFNRALLRSDLASLFETVGIKMDLINILTREYGHQPASLLDRLIADIRGLGVEVPTALVQSFQWQRYWEDYAEDFESSACAEGPPFITSEDFEPDRRPPTRRWSSLASGPRTNIPCTLPELGLKFGGGLW